VRVRLSRARSKLRRDLGEALEPDPPEVPIERRSAVTTFRTSSASPASGATTTEEVSL
jgi:hypothetical protein